MSKNLFANTFRKKVQIALMLTVVLFASQFVFTTNVYGASKELIGPPDNILPVGSDGYYTSPDVGYAGLDARKVFTWTSDEFDISRFETVSADAYPYNYLLYPGRGTTKLVKIGGSDEIIVAGSPDGPRNTNIDISNKTGRYKVVFEYTTYCEAHGGYYYGNEYAKFTKVTLYRKPTVAPTMSLSPTSGGTVYYSKNTALSLTCPVPSTTGTPNPTVTYSWSGTGVSNATSRT